MTAQWPARGDVWLPDLNPTRGHEQAGVRPVVIVSANRLNDSPALLVIAIPVTSTGRNVPWHVPVQPPEGGLRQPSFIKCEDVRSIATERLITFWGRLERATIAQIEDRLRVLLEL